MVRYTYYNNSTAAKVQSIVHTVSVQLGFFAEVTEANLRMVIGPGEEVKLSFYANRFIKSVEAAAAAAVFAPTEVKEEEAGFSFCKGMYATI